MRIMIRHAVTEESREYTLPNLFRDSVPEEIRECVFPNDAGTLIADLIEWLPELAPSRALEGFRGTLQKAMEGGPTGYVGPYLELRRLDGAATVTELHGSPVTVIGEIIWGRVIDDPTDPDGHEPDCTCIFCIPGA